MMRKITMPRRTGPDKVADPRSSMLASHTWNRGAFYSNGTFDSKKAVEEREKEMLCVEKEGLWSIGWAGGLVSGYQLISISVAHNTKTTLDDKPPKSPETYCGRGQNYPKKVNFQFLPDKRQNWPQSHSDSRKWLMNLF